MKRYKNKDIKNNIKSLLLFKIKSIQKNMKI